MITTLLVKTGQVVATGVVGAAVMRAVQEGGGPGQVARRSAVEVAKIGLGVARTVEQGLGKVRTAAEDVVDTAREELAAEDQPAG